MSRASSCVEAHPSLYSLSRIYRSYPESIFDELTPRPVRVRRQ